MVRNLRTGKKNPCKRQEKVGIRKAPSRDELHAAAHVHSHSLPAVISNWTVNKKQKEKGTKGRKMEGNEIKWSCRVILLRKCNFHPKGDFSFGLHFLGNICLSKIMSADFLDICLP